MERTGFLKKKRVMTLLIIIVAVAGSAFGYWKLRGTEVRADYLTAAIERGDIIKSISATGTVQPLVTVQVGSQVSGTIEELFADFNSVVKKGQIVAKLDPSLFQTQLEQAQANLTNAEAAVRSAESSVANAEANLLASEANRERARVAMEDAQRVLKRTIELRESAVVSQRDLEAAQSTADQTAAQFRQAMAQVEQAKAQLLSAKSQQNQAKAQVLQATASVGQVSVNLSHTIIAAPIDGVVVARNVDVGQTVAASLQAPTLFLIANDLTQMQVLADIDEADVGQINSESQITFTVDAYPRDTFRGRISQLRLNPLTEQTVVTYTAVIDVENPELKLKPGMTANVTVTVAEKQDVVKVPNAALRFRPEMTEEQQKEVAALMNAPGGMRNAELKDPESIRTGQPEARSENERPTGDQRPATSDQPRNAGMSRPDSSSSQPRTRGGAEGNHNAGEGRRWTQRPGSDASAPGALSADRQAFGNGGAPRGSRGAGAARAASSPMMSTGVKPSVNKPGLTLTTEIIPGWSPVKAERSRTQVIWVMGEKGQIRPVRVRLGITDGATSELIEGDLKEGDVIVIGQNVGPNGDAAQQRPASPFGGPSFGGRPRGR